MTDLPPGLLSAVAGTYELLQEIGRGGMGVVYAGRDIRLDRLVAIKVLPDIANDEAVRERFLREARAAARLSHPSIVQIYSADERDGITFLVMAFVDGPTLSTKLRDGATLAPADAVPIIRDVALALDAAHARGVIHRDIKPENILVDHATGRAMVTDFGIARITDSLKSGGLTRTGQVLGTVGYMSPEQVTGSELDGRSDLYSLGVVAFEMLSGRLPFDGPPHVVIVAHATKPAPPLATVAPSVPAEICAIVDRLLLKNPAGRFPDGAALVAALEGAVGTHVASAPSALAVGSEARIVSESEADRVWQRAAELQAGVAPDAPPRAPTSAMSIVPRSASKGFKIEHVRQAAIDAGISAAYVTLALDQVLGRRNVAPANVNVAALSRGSSAGVRANTQYRTLSSPRSNVVAAPLQVVYEAEVRGQLSPSDYDVVAQTIRVMMGEPGNVNALGRTLSWSPTVRQNQRRVQVSVTIAGAKTLIRAEERLDELAGPLFGGIMGGGGAVLGAVSIGVTHGALRLPGVVSVAVVGGIVGAGFLLARTIFSHVARKRALELEKLVSTLALEVEHLIDPGRN